MNAYAKLLRKLTRKTFSNPRAGLDPPNLCALIDRASWACSHPDGWTARYLDLLEKDVADAQKCVDAVRGAVSTLRVLRQRRS